MQSTSSASASRQRETRAKTPLLDGRRRCELAGFLLSILGLLLILSLVSYHPLDPSFDTAAASGSVHNWVGVVGSYAADAILQIFGWSAFLLPLFCFVAGIRWLLVRPLESPGAKAMGAALLTGSLAALFELLPHAPNVFGAIRASGIVGFYLAAGLVDTLNRVGAAIVAATALFASLFLVTKFSFSWAARVLHSASRAVFGPLRAHWSARREERERKRLQEQMARERSVGKEPIVSQRAAHGPQPEKPKTLATLHVVPQTSRLDDVELEDEEEKEYEPLLGEPALAEPGIQSRTDTGHASPAKPKVVNKKGAKYKLPATTMLRQPEDQEGVN
ncbi:MAG TPA: DNA translocase FtsK 4TM domain-containing protein, partial [Terriglobia bacterium]|nr:DNA translocase FtsK 4TM domain-containing protein [Terriglobia bacterium]